MVDAALLQELVWAVALLKGAVMLGVDKTGFGYTVTAWVEGNKVLSRYYRPEEDAIEVLHSELQEFIEDILKLSQGT